MADKKRGRDKQAHDAERRQQNQEIATELERWDEIEPAVPAAELTEFETELESLSFPATGAEIVAAIGDHEIQSVDGSYSVEALLPETAEEHFDSPSAVRVQVQRPGVAAAMKPVVEASKTLPNEEFSWTQRTAYEKTFRALKAIDPDDEDEGVEAITDWIVEWIHTNERLPSSRAVRREAAKFCRANGYQVRSDEWLGI